MKRPVVAMFVVAFALSAAMAGSVTGANNKHNLSSTGPGATHTTTEVCTFCHTPHQPTGETQDPLWNHEATAVGAYGVYGSDTMDSTPLEVATATNASTLCMSCHDGTVAVSNDIEGVAQAGFSSGGLVDASGLITGAALVGSDLTNDHPVNMVYNDAITAGEAAMWVASPANSKLFGGTVQCASCHNVHDDANSSFLVMSNANSALCQDCHQK